MTAFLAARLRPEHVTVTKPALRSLVTTKVTLSLLNDDVDLAVVGLVTAQLLSFCDVTKPEGNVSVILLSVACAENAVEVVKVTEAVPAGPTALLKASAFRSATTDPMAGVPIFAATVSTDVLMLIPPLKAAVEGSTTTGDDALALKVNPEQVTEIWPAAKSPFTSRTITLFAVRPLLSVTDAADSFGTSSQLVDVETAVIKLSGKVSEIFPLAATVKADDVWKENVAV